MGNGQPRSPVRGGVGASPPPEGIVAALRLELEQKEREEFELKALLRAARAVPRAKSFQEAAETVFTICKEVTGATSGYVALLSDDGSENEVLFLDAGGRECTVDPSLPMPIRGLRAQSYCSNSAVYHNDFQHSEWMKFMPGGHVRLDNVLFAPIRWGDKTIGLIGLANKPSDFIERDRKVSELFGDIAAIALKTSRDQERLLEDAECFEATFEQAAVGMAHVLPDGSFHRVNRRLAEMLGYAVDELIQLNLFAVTHPEDREKSKEVIQAVLNGALETIELEKRFLHKNGTVVWGRVSSNPVRDAEGTVSYFAKVIEDVTERMLAWQALQESERKHRRIVNSSIDGFWLLGRNASILDVNESACDILGYSSAELLKMKVNDLEAVETPEEIARHIDRVLSSGSDRFETQLKTKDGRVLDIEVNARTLPGSEGVLHSFFRDITERRRSEKATKRLEAELHQSQKMEAVGQLAAGVAHDFNNVLTAIMGHVEMARMDAVTDTPLMEELNGIFSSAERAAGISRALLTFCRKTPARKVSVNLARVVQDSAKMLERMLPAIIDFKIDAVPVEGLSIAADPVQLNQVLVNLVVNARDAMPDGGKLKLTVCAETLSQASGWSELAPFPQDYAVLSVVDTGCGMSEETIARICEPFFTTKPREQGTGLGMSVVHGIVQNHGASLKIDSCPGQGTCVSVAFPIQEQRSSRVKPSEQGAAASEVSATVLIADDNQQIRNLLTVALKSIGCTVIEASDGESAVELFRERPETVELVILDVDMPRRRGTDCYAAMRELRPDLRAVFISGLHAELEQQPLGPNAVFLQKPFRLCDVKTLAVELLESARGTASKGVVHRDM